MNCKQFQLDLPGYLYGETDPAMREEFARHAAGCPGCRKLLGEMEGTVSRLSSVPGPVFSAGELAALRARVKEAVRSPALAPRSLPARSRLRIISRPLFLPVASVLSAAAILLIVFLPDRSREGGRSELPRAAELVAFSEEVEDEDRMVAEVWDEFEAIEVLFSREPDAKTESDGGRVGVPGIGLT